MHSSTSSFRRPIPSAHWTAVWAVTGSLIVIALVAWELYWRAQGYVPGYSDSNDHWAAHRERVGQGDGRQTVFVGASRTRFDLDLDTWERMRGERPIQLATDGSAGYPVLEDLAHDERFRGTVICGITEIAFFAPEFAFPAQTAIERVRYARQWTPSQRVAFSLSKLLETRLAMLKGWDLSLDSLLKRWVQLENREGAVIVPPFPPLFGEDDIDRQARMWGSVQTDSELGKHIQQIWLGLLGFIPPPGGPPLEAAMAKVVASVRAIEARGGQVIFVRFPSTSRFREIERESTPRAAIWDRLLVETGAPGAHFEDHAELSGFDCPEWSHLSAADAPRFTENLVKVLEREGFLPPR